MSYTSKYADSEMNKAVNGGKGKKKFAKKAGKSRTVDSLNRLTQGGKKPLDKGYIKYKQEENRKKKENMTPNDPRF